MQIFVFWYEKLRTPSDALAKLREAPASAVFCTNLTSSKQIAKTIEFTKDFTRAVKQEQLQTSPCILAWSSIQLNWEDLDTFAMLRVPVLDTPKGASLMDLERRLEALFAEDAPEIPTTSSRTKALTEEEIRRRLEYAESAFRLPELDLHQLTELPED